VSAATSGGSHAANATSNTRKDTAQLILDGWFTTSTDERSLGTLDGLGERGRTATAFTICTNSQQAAMVQKLIASFAASLIG
jgi:hypothetical protein